MEEERDKFLLECLTAKEKETDKTQTAAIEAIKRREKARRRYQKVRKVLNRLKAGGLTGLDILIYDEDSNIIGWESIVEADDMNKS